MRFSLYFDLKHKILPLEMNRTIISYIKNALFNVSNGKFYDSFFQGTQPKPYTFSVLLDKPVFEKDRIIVERPMCKVSFSVSNEKKEGFIFINAFLAQKSKAYPLAHNNEMILRNVRLEKEKEIREKSVLVRTAIGGGICVRNHQQDTNKDQYYVVGEEQYEAELNRSVRDQLHRMGYSEKNSSQVSVQCIKGKVVVVKHFGLQIPVTVGYFMLNGPEALLRQLTEVGIGSRRSQGFGMIEIINL